MGWFRGQAHHMPQNRISLLRKLYQVSQFALLFPFL